MAADAGAQVTELTDEDHACLTFGEPEELADLTAAFIRDGLAGGLKVMWLSDASAAGAVAELARRGIDPGPALARGQLAATACDGRLLTRQAHRARDAVGWLAGQLEASRREGFPGLRVAVDMSWALRPVTGWRNCLPSRKASDNGKKRRDCRTVRSVHEGFPARPGREALAVVQ